MTSSVDLRRALFVEAPGGLGATGLHHHDGDVAASIMRPATTSSKVDSALSSNVGCAIHSLPWRDRRTAPIGPSNGMPDTVSAADAPLIDSDVVRVDEVGAHDRGDDLHLVAEALGERRAQRAVGEAAREDGGLARATLTAEHAAGDLAGGVHALLDVDGEREEVDALTGLRW